MGQFGHVWLLFPLLIAPPQNDRAGLGLLEAVQSTLRLHPQLRVQQQQVELGRAIRQQRSGDFDTQLQWSADQKRSNSPMTEAERLFAQQSGFNIDNQALNLTTLSTGTARLLRSGVVIGPRFEIIRTTDNLQIRDGTNRARLSLDVTLPLRRGRGREIVTALESSAGFAVQASQYDLNQTAAELIVATATNYWDYVASLKRLEIITGSEARGREFVENVGVLIRADKIPRSEIYQVQANLAARASDRILAEQQVVDSRYRLALAMGLTDVQRMDLPAPSDAFPDDAKQKPPSTSPESLRFYVEQALQRRADLFAAESRREEADTLRKPARNNLLPQLDLTMSGGYSALQEGRRPDEFLISPFTRSRGPDFVFGLRYSFPRVNNFALGKVAEAEASYQETVLLRSDKERAIASAVPSTAAAVSNSMSRLKQARESVSGFEAALQGEKDKLRLGAGSLTDLLTIESRLTSALLDLVTAQQAYAVALTEFRFATGTLVAPDRDVQSVDRDLFFTVPFQDSSSN